MTIVTLTMNPAVDQTVKVGELRRGEVLRAGYFYANAGGKGVNVASCLADWGSEVVASGILGTENIHLFDKLMKDKKIKDYFLRITGQTRTNIKIVDDTSTTDINLPGLEVDASTFTAINELLYETITKEQAKLLVVSGSLPPGCSPDYYAKLLAELKKRNAGLKIILDTSGPALKFCLESGAMPYCVKPNRHELSEVFGVTLKSNAEIIKYARLLTEKGVELVVVSMGEEGAVFVNKDTSIQAVAEVENLESTVGAGDAMVAGIAAALAENSNLERVARLSTAFSTCKLSMKGPDLPGKEIVENKAATVKIKQVS